MISDFVEQKIELRQDGKKIRVYINGREIYNVRNISFEKSETNVPIVNLSIESSEVERHFDPILSAEPIEKGSIFDD